MILDFFFFPLFSYVIIIIGLGFIRCIDPLIHLNFQKISFPFAILFGLFSIGFVSFTVNFFAKVNNPYVYAVLSIFFLLGLADIKSYTKNEHLLLLLFTLIFTPLASSLGPGYDGGLYHLPH